ncbi:MAG: tRNA-dihydrouridine synthase [Halobacteriales archaeon]|nr:tRNA-dihydrouridine synthase [Halobacteriales archaeon]
MFDPPVAIASLSGQSDAQWALAVEEYIGAAVLGGLAIDDRSREAARAMVERGRDEFLPSDPIAFMDAQLSALDSASIQPGFNVRSTTLEPIRRAAACCARHDAIIEINAHCRQEELCAVGCGETLLADTDRLCDSVGAAVTAEAPVSVKVRTEVPGVDLAETARRVAAAGADMIHVDAMDSEPMVATVVEAAPELTVIANNGVRDAHSVREYLDYGADAVSVGRPSDDPRVLRRVRRAAVDWFAPESKV